MKSRLKEQFLCSFFLNASCIDDANLYITDLKTATSLFINNTAYKNDPTGIYFEDRLYNIPVRYDFWDLNKKLIDCVYLLQNEKLKIIIYCECRI